MSQMNWIHGFARTLAWIVSGAVLMGASCAAELRETIKSAGLDFIGDTASDVLDTVIPISTLLGG